MLEEHDHCAQDRRPHVSVSSLACFLSSVVMVERMQFENVQEEQIGRGTFNATQR